MKDKINSTRYLKKQIKFPVKIFYILKTNMRSKSKILNYLKNKGNVHSYYDLGLGSDILCEIEMQSKKDFNEFESDVNKKFEVFDKEIFNLIYI